jgi:hypothetical protein
VNRICRHKNAVRAGAGRGLRSSGTTFVEQQNTAQISCIRNPALMREVGAPGAELELEAAKEGGRHNALRRASVTCQNPRAK